jgi:hypothetical protein
VLRAKTFAGVFRQVLELGGDHRRRLCVYVRSVTATTVATCDFLLRLLATCVHPDVSIKGLFHEWPTLASGAGLSIFFQESHDSLRKVALTYMALNQDQCRALATMSRLDVELTITCCSLADDAVGAFVECLQSDKGPIQLIQCDIASQILASALTGNSRVTRFKPDFWVFNSAAMAILFTALANNRGLVDLVWNNHIIDDNWSILCESLKAHPTLTSLDLRRSGGGIVLAHDQKVHRTSLLAEMMQRNTVLHTIDLSVDERDEQIYTQDISPYLETNRYRPRLLAIKKAGLSLRRPLLGLALQTQSVRNDSNLLWIFLSGNADVVLPSNEDDESVAVVAASGPTEVASSAQTEGDAIGSTKRKR